MCLGLKAGIECELGSSIVIANLASEPHESFRFVADICCNFVDSSWVAFTPCLVLSQSIPQKCWLIFFALPLAVASGSVCIALMTEFSGMLDFSFGELEVCSDALREREFIFLTLPLPVALGL